jgi:hypothetical protein
MFSKDQRVNHTAIVENKRLGHTLALVKAQQDLRLTTRIMGRLPEAATPDLPTTDGYRGSDGKCQLHK